MAHRLRAAIVAAVTLAVGACSPRQLPARPIPAATLPAGAHVGAPAPGQGRLIVDVVDGPTVVQRVQMRASPLDNGHGRRTFRFDEGFEALCAGTPCVADVPAGTNVLLGFPVRSNTLGLDETEVELVHVGAETSVYRRSLSIYTRRGGGGRTVAILATVLGSLSLTTGATLLPIGAARDHGALTAAGGITLGGGALLLTAGIIGLVRTADTYQPGASNHFAP